MEIYMTRQMIQDVTLKVPRDTDFDKLVQEFDWSKIPQTYHCLTVINSEGQTLWED